LKVYEHHLHAVLLLLISHFAFSQDLGKRISLNVGTDLYQAHYKEQRYKYDDYGVFKNPTKNISRVALGLNYRITKDYPLYLGFRTNRLINNPATLKATDIKTNIEEVDVHQTFMTDNIYIAGYINKHIAPFVVLTRLESEARFMYSSGIVVKTQYLTTLYGVGLAYTFQKHTLAFAYFLPSNTINTKRAFGFSYSYQVASFCG
jgi:hypothetical protein